MRLLKKIFYLDEFKILTQRDNIKKTLLIIVLGFLIHGTYAFDKTIWFDDATSLGGWAPEAAIANGRWAWGLIDYVMKKFVGTELIASWHIANTFLVIAIMAFLLLERFQINSRVAQWALIVYMLVNITVIGNIGYVGSSAMNFVGLLIGLLAALYTFAGLKGERLKLIVAVVALSFSIGMYQCYLAFYISLILLLFINDVLINKEKSLKCYIAFGIGIILITIVALILYFFINCIICKVTGISLSDYAGVSSYGIVDIGTYFERIVLAYKNYFNQSPGYSYSLFPFKWRGWWYSLLTLLILVFLFSTIVILQRKEYKKCFTYIVLNMIFPMACNLTFIMYDVEHMHSLHVYQSIFIFYYLIIIFDYVASEKTMVKYLYRIALCTIILFDVLLIKYDNQCYVSIKLSREQSSAFINRLLADIYDTPGYVDGMQIFVVDLDNLYNSGIDQTSFREGITTNPYFVSPLTYTVNDYILLYNGAHIYIRDLYEGDYEYVGIYDMPKYPSYGSIKVVDDRVIVNL